MKFWLRLRQPVSWFQNEVAFTILLRKREIRKLAVPEIGWTLGPAKAFRLTYVWHFSDRFL